MEGDADGDRSMGARVIQAVRAVHRMGLFEINAGHVSVRVDPGDAFLILGHLHSAHAFKRLDQADEDDLVRVRLGTLAARGRLEPPDEVHIHSAIYEARPEVRAVVHTHAETPVALSIADQPVLPVHHRAGLFAPAVPIFEDHAQIDNPEVGRRLAARLGSAWAIVLRAHGCVSVGRSLEEAVAVMFTLDECARRQLMAAQVGTPRPIEVKPNAPREIPWQSVELIWRTYTADSAV